jgi:hypothetical protein
MIGRVKNALGRLRNDARGLLASTAAHSTAAARAILTVQHTQIVLVALGRQRRLVLERQNAIVGTGTVQQSRAELRLVFRVAVIVAVAGVVARRRLAGLGRADASPSDPTTLCHRPSKPSEQRRCSTSRDSE